MPDFWTLLEEAVVLLWHFLVDNMYSIGGGFVGFVVSLASSYDRETKTVRFADSVVCGFIGLSISPVVKHFALSDGWIIFLSCMVGFLGTVTIRKILLELIDRFITKQK